MENFKISVSKAPAQRFSVTLGDEDIIIILRYSFFGDCWYFSALFSDETPIILSRRIKSGVDIIGNIYANGFVGNFIAVPTQIQETRLGVDAWSTTHELVYSDDTI